MCYSEISIYQFCIFIGASYTIIVSGQVQTGSVFLNAKPERFRCRNQLDELNNSTFTNVAFASAERSCSNWDIDWTVACPNATTVEEYEACRTMKSLGGSVRNLTCSPCEEYIYPDNNTFRSGKHESK